MFGMKTRRAAEELRQLGCLAQAKLDEQHRLGTLLLARLSDAARKNENGCVLLVSSIKDNAGDYSVIVKLKDDGGEHTMMQFDVKLDGLYSLYGPYGPTENFSLDDFENMAEKACTRVRSFK